MNIKLFTLFLLSILTFNAQASYWQTFKKGFAYAQGLFSRAQAGSVMQKRTLLKPTDLKGVDSRIKEEYKHLSPAIGAGMMPIINNLYNHGDPELATTQLINNPKFGLYHKNDHGVIPTRHKSLPGASLNPTIAATLVSHLTNDRLQDDEVQKDIVNQWRQAHKETFGSKANLTATRIQSLLHTLIKAKKETIDTSEKAASFPQFYPYGIITSALWQNATQKKEIDDYLSAAQTLVPLLDQTNNAPEKQKLRLDEEPTFTAEELNQNKNWHNMQDDIEHVEKNITKDFEKNLATEIYLRDGNSPIPGNVRDDYYGFKNFKPVATCAEATLRDICNLILADNNQRFNLELLPKNIKPLEAFANFYQQHPDFLTINDNEVGQAWVNAVSGHQGITYCNNDDDKQNAYEIDPPIDNLLQALNLFFGTTARSFGQFGAELSTEQQIITCEKINDKQVDFTISKPGTTIYAQLNGNPNHAWLEVPIRNEKQDQNRCALEDFNSVANQNIQPRSMQANNILTQRLSKGNAINYLTLPSCLAQLNHLAYSSKDWTEHKKWYNQFSVLEKKVLEAEDYLCKMISTWLENTKIEVTAHGNHEILNEKRKNLINAGFILNKESTSYVGSGRFNWHNYQAHFALEKTPFALIKWITECIKFGKDITTGKPISPFNNLSKSNIETCINMFIKRLANDDNKVKEAIVNFFNQHDINGIDLNSGTPLLHIPELKNFPELLNILLDCKPNLNTLCPKRRMTLLNHIICTDGSYDYKKMAKKIIKLGADVNLATKNYSGNTRTPLHNATIFGFIDVVEELLKAGAQVNGTDNYGATPLHYASEQGHIKVVQMLLESGADINLQCHEDKKTLKYYSGTPLHNACLFGHVDVVRKLLKAGALVNATDKDGATPLHYASEHGHIEIIQTLLEYGADVNGDSSRITPLWLACSLGHLDVVQTLLNAGADVNAKHPIYNDSPLNMAFLHGHVDVVQALLTRNDINVNSSGDQGYIPLEQAIVNKCNGKQIDIIKKLILRGAGLNLRDADGLTPLELAEKKGDEEVINCLQHAMIFGQY